MSTIIKKKDLDLVVENTLKEAGLVTETVETKTVEDVEKDAVNESVTNLVNEMNKDNAITEGLTNELENFKRFINH
jgi:hypothetical protein